MSRRAIRTLTAAWFEAAQIPGLDHVYPGKPPEILWADYGQGDHLCQAYVLVPRRPEKRIAGGGPTNGQKQVDSAIVVHVWFRSTDPDWLAAQDVMDDITEAMVRQVRAGGRVMGRPDIVVSAGEWGPGIVQTDDEPVPDEGGVMLAHSTIAFEISEVINS